MPQCARIADIKRHLRSMKTAAVEHLQRFTLLQRGNPERAGFTRPRWQGAVSRRWAMDSPIPNFVFIDPIPGGNEFETFKAGNWAGWLGAEHAPCASVAITHRSRIPRLIRFPQNNREARETLRKFLTSKYERDRKSAVARIRTPRSSG